MEKYCWRGVNGVRMIWHGEWSDPELEYGEYVANYWEVEDTMWEKYKDECREADFYHFSEDDDSEFNRFCRDYADDVYELIKICSDNAE